MQTDRRPRPCLDPVALARLREVGGEALLREVLMLFPPVARERLSAVQRAIAAADGPGVARAAHAMCGTAANVGARSVERMAQRLEASADPDPAPDRWPAIVRKLERETERAIRYLREHVLFEVIPTPVGGTRATGSSGP